MITTVLENKHISSQYYRLTLKCPEIAAQATPGQFVMIKVNEGILLRRPFSIHRQWTKNLEPEGIQILFRVVGKGTALMSSLAKGAKVDLIGPLGQGFRLRRTISNPVLVAGGIGVAPLLFLADQLKVQNPLSHPRLFLGGKTAADILCQQDFQKQGFLLKIATEDGSLGQKGLITGPLSSYLEQAPEAMLLACGPQALMSKIIEMARQYHLKGQVCLEEKMACGVGACLGCVVKLPGTEKGYQRVCTEGPVFEIG